MAAWEEKRTSLETLLSEMMFCEIIWWFFFKQQFSKSTYWTLHESRVKFFYVCFFCCLSLSQCVSFRGICTEECRHKALEEIPFINKNRRLMGKQNKRTKLGADTGQRGGSPCMKCLMIHWGMGGARADVGYIWPKGQKWTLNNLYPSLNILN